MQQIWNWGYYVELTLSKESISYLAYLFLSSAGAGDVIEGKMNTRNKERFILYIWVFEEELSELSLSSYFAIL